MGIDEFCETTGHWVWQRDLGARWLLDEAAGPAASLYDLVFAPEPEHWFRVREDGKLAVRVVTSGTEPGGEEGIIDVSGSIQEGVTWLAGENILARTCTYADGGRLVIEWLGTRKGGSKVHLRNSKEIIGGMYHSTFEDLVRNVKGTRVFKRYPWYKIENMTGEAVTLSASPATGLMSLFPGAGVELRAGTSYIDASSADADREQAVFRLADGREYSVVIEDSQTITLEKEHFKDFPYYEVENLTGEEVSVETYGATDFMHLFPSAAVAVKPGRSCVLASSRGALLEQAVFTLRDGRSCIHHDIKAFDTATLDPGHFR